MSDSDTNESSFEVLEEEARSADLSGPAGECGATDCDRLWDSCPRVNQTPSLNSQSTSTFLSSESCHLAENRQNSWSQSKDHSIVPCDGNAVEGSRHAHNKRRPKIIRTLFPLDLQKSSAYRANLTPIISHHKCITALTGLLSISLALFYTTIRNSIHVSRLQDELASSKLQHARELLHLSEKHCTQETKIQALILELEQERRLLHELRLQSEQRLSRESQSETQVAELQKQRDELLSELRAQSELHTAREAESSKLILELQAERRQLMDAVERNTQQKVSDCDSPRSRQLFRKALRQMKKSLRELHKRSLLVPGMQYFHDVFCKIPHLCDEF